MLKDIPIKPIYDSSECSIVNDFLVPVLSNSIEYWRGVGYFSSGWLSLTASGIEHIAEKNGKIRFVVSPLISETDKQAFLLAKEAKENEILHGFIRKNISEIASNLKSDLVNTFAWLLADGIIEFKFAIPKGDSQGDYHDKVGICIDAAQDIVAFHGSFNDTYKGSLNGEAFSVFQSWESGQKVYAQIHFKRLIDLWNNGNAQFDVIPFDEAIKKEFISLRNAERPYKKSTTDKSDLPIRSNEPSNPFVLKQYQEDAIDAWSMNNYKGIFEMATGTGKTITALASILKLFNSKKRLFVVIVVPFIHLLDQWQNNCKKFNIKTISCSGENQGWQSNLHELLLQFRTGITKLGCVIVVQNTACSEAFLKKIIEIPPSSFMMIADETHYLGARHLQKALFPTATYRLGLSATPERWMDPDGSRILFSYYEKVVYRITLQDAIANGHLTPYKYNPIIVYLTHQETDKVIDLSRRISKILASAASRDDLDEETLELVKQLELNRARIIMQAENKKTAYVDLLNTLLSESNQSLKDLLVFCAPGTHESFLQQTSSLGIKTHEFVHYLDLKERQRVLGAFSKGEIEALISIKCMDEGVDVPSTQTAIFLASSTNPKEFIQRRGRVLRKYPGKDSAYIYDFIVFPPLDMYFDKDCVNTILRRELPRFADFADGAANKFSARQKILGVLEHFDMQTYIDEKPWDIYQNALQQGDVSNV